MRTTPNVTAALAALAIAVTSPAPAWTQAAATGGVSRSDLAASYQRVDRLVIAARPDSATLADVSRAFDQTTLAFFAGRYVEAVRSMHRIAGRLLGDTLPDGPMPRVAGLRVEGRPPVAFPGAGDRSVQVVPMVPVAGATPLEVRVRLVDGRSREVASGDVRLEPGAAEGVPLPVRAGTLGKLKPGRYRAYGRPVGGGQELLLGTWDVMAESPDSIRERLRRRTAALDPAANPHAVAAFRARLGLLAANPSPDRSAQFLADPNQLARDLDREAAALLAGRDPYRGLAGHLWRTIIGPGGQELPVRVFAPPGEGARPVVIALHGAGADENAFPEAYGAGTAVRLAEREGAILLSPRTDVFQRDPAFLDSLLAVVRRDHTVDSTRVYLLGHSLGAAAAWAAALARPAQVAGVAVIGGAGRPPAAGAAAPPSLWLSAELDPLAAPGRVRQAAEAARAAGAEVEYRELPGLGHTMMVAPALPIAFDWLLARRLGAR